LLSSLLQEIIFEYINMSVDLGERDEAVIRPPIEESAVAGAAAVVGEVAISPAVEEDEEAPEQLKDLLLERSLVEDTEEDPDYIPEENPNESSEHDGSSSSDPDDPDKGSRGLSSADSEVHKDELLEVMKELEVLDDLEVAEEADDFRKENTGLRKVADYLASFSVSQLVLKVAEVSLEGAGAMLETIDEDKAKPVKALVRSSRSVRRAGARMVGDRGKSVLAMMDMVGVNFFLGFAGLKVELLQREESGNINDILENEDCAVLLDHEPLPNYESDEDPNYIPGEVLNKSTTSSESESSEDEN
jgi:hypothetical protein